MGILPELSGFFIKAFITCCGNAFAGHYNIIVATELLLGFAKRLSNDALYPVAINRSASVLAGNDKTKTGITERAGTNQNNQIGRRQPKRNLIENLLEVAGGQQASGFAKRLWVIHSLLIAGHDRLDGDQHLAAFCATTVKYQATIFGGHACAKTVGALALDNAWLKCSFHCFDSIVVAVFGLRR